MEHISLLISTYSAFILLPLMIVEGPIVTIIAAFLASLGVLSIVLVYFLSLAGNIIGDVGYYSMGRFGRDKFVVKYGKYFGLHEEKVKYIEEHYKNHFLKTIIIAKVTEAPIVPTLVAAGIARVDFRKYFLATASMEVPKVLIVTMLGYFFGKFYKTIEIYFKDFVSAAAITLTFAAVTFFIYRRLKPKPKQ